LHQNYPNPFNPNTNIGYQIPERSFVILKVFDALGNEIETLVNKELEAGSYQNTFDAEGLSSGTYFYQLKTGKYLRTMKMILLK
ncbi:MAG: T9SS type A sorting domain-containing protein, partial [Ignavibacteriaceae bacterium]